MVIAQMARSLVANYWPSPSTCRLINVVVSINVGSHFMLYLDGVVDNLLPAAHSFLKKHYHTEAEGTRQWELMVSLRMYGLAIGCLAATFMSRNWGRKPQVVVGMVLNIVGILLTTVIMYIPGGLAAAHIGRLINGCGQGIVQTAGTVMLLELPPRRCRGTVLATMTVFACMGELLSMLLSLEEIWGNAKKWHWAMAFPIILLVPAFFVLLRAPESPRYLFMEGRQAEATRSLEFYQIPSDAKRTESEMMGEIDHADIDINANAPLLKKKTAASSSGVKNRLLEGRFLRPLFVGIVLHSLVHLDDWLWVSYSTHIFEQHGFNMASAQKASLIMSLPQSLLSIGLITIFEKFPRKSLLIYPTLASALIGLTSIITLGFTPKKHKHVSLLSCVLPFLASIDLCMAGISGESAFTIVPELFLYQDRILGTAICGIAQSLFGGMLLNFLLSALNNFGAQKVLVPFVFGNLFYAAFNAIYVPETSMKSPQEVADVLERTFSRRYGGIKEIMDGVRRRISSVRCLGTLWQVASFAVQIALCFLAINLVFLAASFLFPSASSILVFPDRHILRAARPP